MWIMRKRNVLTFKIDFYLYYKVGILKKISEIFALTLYKLC